MMLVILHIDWWDWYNNLNRIDLKNIFFRKGSSPVIQVSYLHGIELKDPPVCAIKNQELTIWNWVILTLWNVGKKYSFLIHHSCRGHALYNRFRWASNPDQRCISQMEIRSIAIAPVGTMYFFINIEPCCDGASWDDHIPLVSSSIRMSMWCYGLFFEFPVNLFLLAARSSWQLMELREQVGGMYTAKNNWKGQKRQYWENIWST